MRTAARLVVVLFLFAAGSEASASEVVHLGALVEVRGQPAVRVTFAGEAGAWSGLCRKGERSEPPALAGGTRFHGVGGAPVATISLTGPSDSKWVGSGCLFEPSPDTLPTGDWKRHRVAGWDGWNELAVLSTARPSPPVAAKEAALPAERRDRLVEAFLATPPVRDWCGREPRSCPPDDVEATRSLSLPSGYLLARIAFETTAQECDQNPWGHCSGVWMISRGAEAPPQVLDEFVDPRTGWATDLELLEVADFDGDSKLEYLFWLDAYNENGFVLYYDDFRRHAVFSYGFH